MPDSDGDLRCYPADCNLLPVAQECGEDDNYDQYMVQILGNVFTAKILIKIFSIIHSFSI